MEKGGATWDMSVYLLNTGRVCPLPVPCSTPRIIPGKQLENSFLQTPKDSKRKCVETLIPGGCQGDGLLTASLPCVELTTQQASNSLWHFTLEYKDTHKIQTSKESLRSKEMED